MRQFIRSGFLALTLLTACGQQLPDPPSDAPVGAILLWPVPTDPLARIQAAGLTALHDPTIAMHIHVHLDVYKDGTQIVVPANIGIDSKDQLDSPVHTHHDMGLVHIESAVKRDYWLGQFLTEWDVSPAGAIAYVNGTQAPDPAGIVLHDMDEIALIYGRAPALIPSSF